MNDFFGNPLKIGDRVAVAYKNRLIDATIVGFTPKKIRIEFDFDKYRWAVSYAHWSGIHKGKTPTLLVTLEQVVRKD